MSRLPHFCVNACQHCIALSISTEEEHAQHYQDDSEHDIPVSYTHLDVYKRQTLALVLFVSLDGVQLILDTLRETFDTAIRSGASELDPKSLIIAGVRCV